MYVFDNEAVLPFVRKCRQKATMSLQLHREMNAIVELWYHLVMSMHGCTRFH